VLLNPNFAKPENVRGQAKRLYGTKIINESDFEQNPNLADRIEIVTINKWK
jgi:hypothetical protein